MKRSYELDETDKGLIEQLTRWRVQELDSQTPENRIHALEIEIERKHLAMLRAAMNLSSDRAALARNPKTR